MKKKRIVCIAALVVICLGLVGCDKNLGSIDISSTESPEGSASVRVRETSNPQESMQTYSDSEVIDIAKVCQSGFLWGNNSGFTNSSVLSTDEFLYFFYFNKSVNIADYYDKNLKQYYIPVTDVENFSKQNFEEVKFVPENATLLVYDSENEYFIGEILEVPSEVNDVEILQTKQLDNGKVSITSQYDGELKLDIVVKSVNGGYKIISVHEI